MKYLLIALAVLLCNCSPYLMPDPRPEDLSKNLLLQVECRNSQQAETSVIQTLKLVVRYNDFEKQNYGTVIVIKARYSELPIDKARFLIDQLKAISGVLDVEIIRDGVPVKNIVPFPR